MFNVIYYSNNSIDFLNTVIKSKNKRPKENQPFYKDRIVKFKTELALPFNNYDLAFTSNILYTVQNDKKFQIKCDKDDLLNLYSYSSKIFVNFKNDLVKLPNDRSFDTCQYCGINSINTLDHILPKDLFPEFVVHPKNLFPACSDCNSKKSKKWLNNGLPEFLNLYTDILPNKQFLFVDIVLSDNTFKVKFNLQNKNSIDPNLFLRISKHFENLNLLERYQRQASGIISNFETTIFSNLENNSLDQMLSISRNSFAAHRNNLGYNHFKIILEEELCNGLAFREYCNLKGVK